MALFFSIFLFLAVLIVLILVHEWGHYIVAKLTGMRVDEFGIGFPPKVASFTKGETEYTLNALPIGGFVRIYGEDPTQPQTEDVDRERAFSARPRWAQALVLIAGVTMNALLAWVLLSAILMIGAPTAVSEAEAGPSAQLTITSVLSGSPAEGIIPPGAVVAGVTNVSGGDALTTLTPTALSEYVQARANEELAVSYELGEANETVLVTPVAGAIADNPDRAVLGVELTLTEERSLPFFEAVTTGFMRTVELTQAITVGVFSLFAGIFTGNADLSQVAGPVGIVGYVGDAAAVGLVALLFFTAQISLSLAVINLLPIPALDGGRLIFVAIESITRRPIDPVWTARVNTAGFIFLMLLMLVVTVSDVMKLW